MRQFTLLKDLPPIATQGMIFVPDGSDYREIMNRAVFLGSYVENNPDLFLEHKDTEESSKPLTTDGLISLLRDCVSETWGNTSMDKTQELFDLFLHKRGFKEYSEYRIGSKPFVWTDELVFEWGEEWRKYATSLSRFKEKKQNSIKAGELKLPIPEKTDKPLFRSEGKDWEIVAYKSTVNDMVVSDFTEWDRPKSWYASNKKYTIHSVKRLSDGEVFSVKDDTQFGIIKSFRLYEESGIMEVHFEDGSGTSFQSIEHKISKPQPQQESKIKDQIVIDLQEMRKDKSGGSYYYSWQANIAVAFQDAYREEFGDSPRMRHIIHEVSNNAAKRFLDQLIHIPSDETI